MLLASQIISLTLSPIIWGTDLTLMSFDLITQHVMNEFKNVLFTSCHYIMHKLWRSLFLWWKIVSSSYYHQLIDFSFWSALDCCLLPVDVSVLLHSAPWFKFWLIWCLYIVLDLLRFLSCQCSFFCSSDRNFVIVPYSC